MGLSTHILDTSRGRPAVGVAVHLAERRADAWIELGSGLTDTDGRCTTLLGELRLDAATYRLRFDTKPYFEAQQLTSLYPYVEIVFQVRQPHEHHHIPLLLAANGYTTYRGS